MVSRPCLKRIYLIFLLSGRKKKYAEKPAILNKTSNYRAGIAAHKVSHFFPLRKTLSPKSIPLARAKAPEPQFQTPFEVEADGDATPYQKGKIDNATLSDPFYGRRRCEGKGGYLEFKMEG